MLSAFSQPSDHYVVTSARADTDYKPKHSVGNVRAEWRSGTKESASRHVHRSASDDQIFDVSTSRTFIFIETDDKLTVPSCAMPVPAWMMAFRSINILPPARPGYARVP
jgi:hypothetical protein